MGGMNMGQVLKFPQKQEESPVLKAMKAMEKRFGVSFEDYMELNGKRTPETQEAIDRALRKETLLISHHS